MRPTESSTHEQRPLKVYLFNTGVGIINRGIESFMREFFEGLRGRDDVHVELFTGHGGTESKDEHRLACLPRAHPLATLVGRATGRTGYVFEQLTAFPSFARRIRAGRPDILFLGDGRLNMRLYHWLASTASVPFRVLFHNASPVKPPFPYAHHVQQVAPWLLDEALRAGEPPAKHSLVPDGIRVPASAPESSPQAIREIRQRLNLPLDRKIILSVGWISRTHKRMDYTVNEVALLPEPRPYLVMLGRMDDTSEDVLEIARQRLGLDNFTARSVAYEDVPDYYKSADIFVLSSTYEAFGRVYLEALIAGLPCVAHDFPTSRYVLGEGGIFRDLSTQGNLAQALTETLAVPNSQHERERRRSLVRNRFGWEALIPSYLEMFRKCFNSARQPVSDR
jgi:1,2-diacylglycerol 3-alpha-glucosyltransferase